MNVLVTPLGVVGLIAIMYLLYIFANLSRRLGAVTKMKPYYRGYYAALAFLSVSFVSRVVLSSVALSPPSLRPALLSSPFFSLVAYHIPFAIATVHQRGSGLAVLELAVKGEIGVSGTGAKNRSPASRKVRVSSPAPLPTPSSSRRPTAKGKVATLSDTDWPVARWQMMFEGLHDPAYLVDQLGVICCANSASEHSPLNYPRNKILGRALLEFFPVAQQASLEDRVGCAAQEWTARLPGDRGDSARRQSDARGPVVLATGSDAPSTALSCTTFLSG